MKQIHEMTLPELRAHNSEVVARIKALMAVEAAQQASRFYAGQLVEFSTGKGGFPRKVRARVTGINQKTVAVTEVDNPARQWRVSPGLLTPVKDAVAA